MWDFFDLKRNRYNICGNYLLKLSETSSCRYGTQALCLEESLLWNKIPNKYKNLILSKSSRVKSKNEILLSVAVKFVNRRILEFFVRDRR